MGHFHSLSHYFFFLFEKHENSRTEKKKERKYKVGGWFSAQLQIVAYREKVDLLYFRQIRKFQNILIGNVLGNKIFNYYFIKRS